MCWMEYLITHFLPETCGTCLNQDGRREDKGLPLRSSWLSSTAGWLSTRRGSGGCLSGAVEGPSRT